MIHSAFLAIAALIVAAVLTAIVTILLVHGSLMMKTYKYARLYGSSRRKAIKIALRLQ